MNVRCNAAPPNSCSGAAQASLAITIPGVPASSGYLGIPMAATFGGLGTDSPQTCAGTGGVRRSNCFEWLPTTPTSKYDLAQRTVSVTTGSNTWTGAGGLFDTASCAGTALACTDSDADGKCEFNTTAVGAPTAVLLQIWLVREDQGSWNEIGSSTLAGAPYSRDTDMRTAVNPVCAPYPAP